MAKRHELLAEKLQVKSYFYPEYITLFLFGFDFYSKEKPFYRLWFSLLNVLSLSLISIALAHFLYAHIQELNSVDETMPQFIKISLAVFKFTIIFIKKRDIIELVHKIWEISENANEAELKILTKFNKQSSRLEMTYFYFILVTIVVRLTASIARTILIYITKDEFVFQIPIMATYILNLRNPINFLIICAWNANIFFAFTCSIAGIDTLYCWSVHNVTAQFCILQLRFELLPKQNKYNICKSISDTIAYHQQTLELTERLSQIFRPIVFAEYTMSAIPICFGAYQLVRGVEIGQKFYLVCFLFAVLVQLLLYSIGGQYLENTCDLLTSYIFENIHWENTWSNSDRKMLALALMRAQRPCKISAIFFDVNMNSFVKVVQTAVSYVTILRGLNQ